MSDDFVCVFPGQGAQSVGMLSVWCASNALVQATFEEANQVLGYDLLALTQKGPEAQLNQTEYTQPALLTAGVAAWRVFQSHCAQQPKALAGHSLGEYTALVCAGSLSLADGLRCVQERARAMQAAVPEGVGAMAAILGAEDAVIATVCEAAAQGEVVAPVNFNAPGQTVIAGHKTAVERAMIQLKEQGAKRALLLPVSVPSHCALMKPAALRLTPFIRALDWRLPQIPVIQNVDVQIHQEIPSLIEALLRQLYFPVRWVETIEKMATQASLLLEFGPGRVLCGLNKRIAPRVQALPVFDDETLATALRALEN